MKEKKRGRMKGERKEQDKKKEELHGTESLRSY
jgi:hypothetical protein